MFAQNYLAQCLSLSYYYLLSSLHKFLLDSLHLVNLIHIKRCRQSRNIPQYYYFEFLTLSYSASKHHPEGLTLSHHLITYTAYSFNHLHMLMCKANALAVFAYFSCHWGHQLTCLTFSIQTYFLLQSMSLRMLDYSELSHVGFPRVMVCMHGPHSKTGVLVEVWLVVSA